MSEKIIRDPVHDVIAFRLDKPEDALLFDLLGTPEVQRLRRIRQLGLASLAYPGADHSRYSHSLGVMQTARRMLRQLAESFPIDPGESTVCVAAALLHDLGHGPFSHVFERVSGLEHEKLTARIIQDPRSGVNRRLRQFAADLPDRVVGLLRGNPRTLFSQIISSQLDADRFDYLLRDNLMTGSRYGDFDLQWLLHALAVEPGNSRLAVTWKGVSAVEAYLQSRYHMYRNVYFHKVVRTAEGMVKLALQRARLLAAQGRLDWPPPGDGMFLALTGRRMELEQFIDLDDVSMQHCFKLWSRSDDAILSSLCAGLQHRQLYKTFDLSNLDSGSAAAAIEAAAAAVTSAGGDAGYAILYDEPADTPYEIGDASPASDIRVLEASGKISSFADLSPLPRVLSRQLMFRRLHVAPVYEDVVARALKR